jgi:peptidyl-prolyl cis-trans isomerase C
MSLRFLSTAIAAFFVVTSAWAQTDNSDASPAPAVKPAPKAASKAPAGAVASVNGKAIPKSRVDFFLKQQAAQGMPDNEQTRRAIRENLVSQEVVAQEAEKKGFAKGAEFRTQMDLTRQRLLIQAYVQDHFKQHPIKDDQLLAEYNKVKAVRGGDKEYKARHILVDKESEAKDIIAQLKKGAKFEDLAKQSKDTGSKDRGGDLDWNTPGTFVKPFADAMTRLEKGKYTETPVQSPFGWHVIQLEDVRQASFPSFDEVKPQLMNRLQEQEVQKLVQSLRAKAQIVE